MIDQLIIVIKKLHDVKMDDRPDIISELIQQAITIIIKLQNDQHEEDFEIKRVSVIRKMEFMQSKILEAFVASNNFKIRSKIAKAAIRAIERDLIVYLSRFNHSN